MITPPLHRYGPVPMDCRVL